MGYALGCTANFFIRGRAGNVEAQERIEQLRSFQCVTADGCTVPGALLFTGLTSGNDSISQSAEYQTNTTFQRSWQVLGDASDTMRRVVVTVAWTDRTGEAQSVALATVIARVDPTDVGSLGFPLPANTTLKRPKNRSMNIPVPAIELKKYPGHSAYNFGSYAIVFSNDSGYVVKKCDFEVNADSDVTECAVYDAYILAGYVSMHDGLAFPPGLAVNIGLPLTEGATARSTCSAVEVARDQNNPDPNTNQIPGFKYYLCVMKVPKTGDVWSGMVRLAAPALNAGATDYIVCRFQYPKEVFGVSTNSRHGIAMHAWPRWFFPGQRRPHRAPSLPGSAAG